MPWSGIQGKPAFLDGPDGDITIPDVRGLTEALASKATSGSFARVAFTGAYNDLTGRPVFGSAAFANVDNFITPAQLTVILDSYTTKPQALARAFCKC